MAGVPRPNCPNCQALMISVCARLGKGSEDRRQTSRKPYKRVGWTCMECHHIERSSMPENYNRIVVSGGLNA